MKIGIDISQLAYENTGVANYLGSLVLEMVKNEDTKFVLFFSSLRGKLPERFLKLSDRPNVEIVIKKIPQAMLHLMWNVAHRNPIENFIGDVDLFITSDWTEPPAKRARKATILYDLIVYKFPEETAKKIVGVQKKKLSWVMRESDIIFCISESTKKDAQKILGVDSSKLSVVYPGF